MSLSNFNVHLDRPETLEALAKALNVAPDFLREVTENAHPMALYRIHKIPKRRKAPDGSLQVRVVWEAQSPALAFCHKAVARRLTAFLTNNVHGFPHPDSNGFVRGRSTRRNAAPHAGAKRILSVDLANFFESVSKGMVENSLRNAGIKTVPARILATLLAPQGFLQPGFAASPIVANLVLAPLDEELARLSASRGLNYSRYADDLTFSGECGLPTLAELDTIVARYRLRINPDKFKLSKRGQRHTVTGLTVTDGECPHVPRRFKRNLSRELHFIEKFGMRDHVARRTGSDSLQQTVNRVDGWINYINSIEAAFGQKLRSQWDRICRIQNLERSFAGRPFEAVRDAIWVVDEMEFTISGVHCLALLCADVFDASRVSKEVEGFRMSLLQDAALAPKQHAYLAEKGLHWEHLTMSQRLSLAETLSVLPFRCTCAFAPIDGDYAGAYVALLRHLLAQAMLGADDANVTVEIERNDHVSEPVIAKTIESAWLQLSQAVRRHPASLPEVRVLRKGQSPLLPVADAMLGILKWFADFRGKEPDEKFRAFERTKFHFKLIFDGVRKKVFSSRYPMPPFEEPVTPALASNASSPIAE